MQYYTFENEMIEAGLRKLNFVVPVKCVREESTQGTKMLGERFEGGESNLRRDFTL